MYSCQTTLKSTNSSFGTDTNLQSLLPKTAIFELRNMIGNRKLFNHLLSSFMIHISKNSKRGKLGLNKIRKIKAIKKRRLAVNDKKKLDS